MQFYKPIIFFLKLWSLCVDLEVVNAIYGKGQSQTLCGHVTLVNATYVKVIQTLCGHMPLVNATYGKGHSGTLWTCEPHEDDQGRVIHLIQFLMFGILIL